MRNEILGSYNQLSQDQILERVATREGVKPARVMLMALLALWAQRYRQRRKMARDLRGFTDEVLKDFGLTRQEATKLAHRPFWRASYPRQNDRYSRSKCRKIANKYQSKQS